MRGVTSGRSPTALRARVLELRRDPELTCVVIGQRLGIDPSTVRRLAVEPPARKQDIGVGDKVRVIKRGRHHQRVGVVVEVPPFPFRDYRRLSFDSTETELGVVLMLPLEDLTFVAHTGQLPLFDGAA